MMSWIWKSGWYSQRYPKAFNLILIDRDCIILDERNWFIMRIKPVTFVITRQMSVMTFRVLQLRSLVKGRLICHTATRVKSIVD